MSNKHRNRFTQPLGQAIQTCTRHMENVFVHVGLMSPPISEAEVNTAVQVAEELLASVNQKYGVRLTYAIAGVMHKTCVSQALSTMESTRDREMAKTKVKELKDTKEAYDTGRVAGADSEQPKSPESTEAGESL